MRDVFSEIVDYAGLFPPATCSMADAVRNYHGYRTSSDQWMLGRFVVSAARLEELSGAIRGLDVLPDTTRPWQLSTVLGTDLHADLRRIDAFNAQWPSGGVIVDAVECKVSSIAEVDVAAATIPRTFLRHFEVPIEGPYHALIAAMRDASASAKVRTGGTTPELFPASAQLALFLAAVTELGVAFKATAGLHHPLRGNYPLTYAQGAPRHSMYGFVNVLLATTELARGGTTETASAILEDSTASHFSTDESGMQWSERHFTKAELLDVRARFFLAFGSCSFREPVDELRDEGLA